MQFLRLIKKCFIVALSKEVIKYTGFFLLVIWYFFFFYAAHLAIKEVNLSLETPHPSGLLSHALKMKAC